MSIYMDHSVKLCVPRHKLYLVASTKTWIILCMPIVKSTCYPVLCLVRPLLEMRYLTVFGQLLCLRIVVFLCWVCRFIKYVLLLMLCFYLIYSCQHKKNCEVAKPVKMPWVFNVIHFFNFYCMV